MRRRRPAPACTARADVPEPTDRPAGESSKTLDRGIRLLEVLARPGATGGLTITALSTELGVGRPVVYRLVASLAQHQLVSRRADGRVRLGLGLTRLAAAVTPLVRSEALPVLRELADAVGATAHLTVADGEEALALVVVEPSNTDYHVAYRSGARHRLDQGAAGRAILAGRKGGSAVVSSDGELQSGAHGLAAPIVAGGPGSGGDDGGGAHGAFEASVGVVSLHALDVEVIGPRLVAAATRLSELLG